MYKTFMKQSPRDQPPAQLMPKVDHLWQHHFQNDRTGAGLRGFTQALFDLKWVAQNVPRNPNTERMMAQLVSVLITAVMECVAHIHMVHQYFRSVTSFFLEAKMLVGK